MDRFFKDMNIARIRRKRSAQCGFSLIELVIVIAVMAVLVGLIAPQFVRSAKQKRIETCKQNRESILRIYERAVYDGSVKDVLLDDDGITKVLDKSFKPSAAEVDKYLYCPNKSGGGAAYHGYVMDGSGAEGTEKNGSACIYCPDCDNTVSVDLLGWGSLLTDESVDPNRDEPVYPTPTPPDDIEYTVRFNLNGVSGSPKPADQKVKSGETAAEPSPAPSKTFYEFLGWYTEQSCADGTRYTFTEAVTADITLYAKWENQTGGSSIWPYSDDQTWWDPSLIDKYHAGEYDSFDKRDEADMSSFRNNAKLTIYVPTGIFTSRSGAQFVLIDSGGNGLSKDLFLKYAASPEVYAARYPQYLIQLTGNKRTINITGLPDQLKDAQAIYPSPYIINGDLLEFIDGNTVYTYVYFHDELSDSNNNNNTDTVISDLSIVRNYQNKIGNYYRVNKQPITTS